MCQAEAGREQPQHSAGFLIVHISSYTVLGLTGSHPLKRSSAIIISPNIEHHQA